MNITGTFLRADGVESQFQINSEGTLQWGAPSSELGQTRDVLDAMADAARGSGFFDEPEDESEAVTVTPEQITAFTEAIKEAAKACEGDSNDEEIDALWNAIDEACDALGLNRMDYTE